MFVNVRAFVIFRYDFILFCKRKTSRWYYNIYCELLMTFRDYSIFRKSGCHSVNAIVGPLGLIYKTTVERVRGTTHAAWPLRIDGIS